MSIAELIRKRTTLSAATANAANPAIKSEDERASLAGIAALAIANPQKVKTRTAADDRIDNLVGQLRSNGSLNYVMATDLDAEPGFVVITLAINGKAACELFIEKTRYDPFMLLEMFEKHTTRTQ